MGYKHHPDKYARTQHIASVLKAAEETEETLRAEKVAAEKQALLAQAYRQMPADMRARAEEWGVGALMELVWLNGFDCGYRQSSRDQSTISKNQSEK